MVGRLVTYNGYTVIVNVGLLMKLLLNLCVLCLRPGEVSVRTGRHLDGQWHWEGDGRLTRHPSGAEQSC